MKKRISATLIVSVLFILSVFTFVPVEVKASTEYLDPDLDRAVEWTPTGCGPDENFDCVDDAIRQPATGVDGNYLTGVKNDYDNHYYENPTAQTGTVSAVEVWIYGRTGDANDYFGVLPGVTDWAPSTVNTAAPGTSNVWVSAEWTGLSLPIANFNGLRVRVQALASGQGGGTWVMEAIYTEITWSAVTPASLTVTLRQSDNTQERIDVGFWGNVTATPGGSDVNSTNFVRAQCDDCDGTDDSFWVNWSGTTWESAKTGDTIDIDNNFIFYYYETTSGSADPDDGGWSWSDSGVDADGNYQITFTNSGTTYVWVRYRIEAIPSPLSGCDDLKQDYTVELDR